MKKSYITPELEVNIIYADLMLQVLTVSGNTSDLGETPTTVDGKVRFDDASTVINTNDTQW